jgi:hypothetical protein
LQSVSKRCLASEDKNKRIFAIHRKVEQDAEIIKNLVAETLSLIDNNNGYAILKDREIKIIGGNVLPHYVFIVEDTRLLENEPINKYLYNGSAKIGVSTVFIAKNAAYLPMNCRVIVTLQGKSAEIADRVSGEKVQFMPDYTELKNLELAARKLASLRIKNSSANFALPKTITLYGNAQSEKGIGDRYIITLGKK